MEIIAEKRLIYLTPGERLSPGGGVYYAPEEPKISVVKENPCDQSCELRGELSENVSLECVKGIENEKI